MGQSVDKTSKLLGCHGGHTHEQSSVKDEQSSVLGCRAYINNALNDAPEWYFEAGA